MHEFYTHDRSIYISQEQLSKLEQLAEDYDTSFSNVFRYLIEDEYKRRIYYPPRLNAYDSYPFRKVVSLSNEQNKMLNHLCDRFHYRLTDVMRALIDEEWERRFGKWKM